MLVREKVEEERLEVLQLSAEKSPSPLSFLIVLRECYGWHSLSRLNDLYTRIMEVKEHFGEFAQFCFLVKIKCS